MLIIARTTGVQTVVMNGNSNTRAHESYDSVLVGTGKQKGLESLSENRDRRGEASRFRRWHQKLETPGHRL